MKRFTAILLTIVLLFSMSIAYASNYSSMLDDQLKEQYDMIRNMLFSRGLKAEKKTVILEDGGVQIYVSGDPSIENTWSGLYLVIPIVIINDSGKNITVTMDNSSVNGWTADASIYSNDVPSGKKAKTEIKFELEDTDIETIAEYDDVEFTITVYDKDDWFGQQVVPETKPIRIFSAQTNK